LFEKEASENVSAEIKAAKIHSESQPQFVDLKYVKRDFLIDPLKKQKMQEIT